MSQHTVYAIASGKGGVGKTTTTVNLGASLAATGERVVIVDADLGMANLDSFLGLTPDGPTLHEVLAGKVDVSEATYDAPGNLDVVPSGAELAGYADVDTSALAEIAAELRAEYDYVLLDVGAGVTHDSVLPLGIADAVLLVTTPDIAAVRDTVKTREITERLDGTVMGLVLTRVGHRFDLDAQEVAGKLSTRLLAIVPEDEAVGESLFAREPTVVHAPDSPASTVYREFSRAIAGDENVLPVLGDAADGVSVDESGGQAADEAAGSSTDESAETVEIPDAEGGVAEAVEIPDAEAAESGDAPEAAADADDATAAETGADASTPDTGDATAESDAGSPSAGDDTPAAESEASTAAADAEPASDIFGDADDLGISREETAKLFESVREQRDGDEERDGLLRRFFG